jgi:hypothetical protein
MPEDDDPSATPIRYQHCLYLLAETERVIDRSATEWSPVEAASVAARLVRLAERLTRQLVRPQ